MSDSLQVSTDVAARPDRVIELVSDVTRIGEWSPETVSCRWRGNATGPRVGARFTGANRHRWHRWSTSCTVTAADHSRFAFRVTSLGLPVAEWAYDARLAPGGSTVTESWTDLRGGLMRRVGAAATGVADRVEHNRAGMQRTLAALKAVAERS